MQSNAFHAEANKTDYPNKRFLAESSLLSMSDDRNNTMRTGSRSFVVVKKRDPNNRFWLFLTTVKNYFSEQQIQNLVTDDTLGSDNVVVKKLIPA